MDQRQRDDRDGVFPRLGDEPPPTKGISSAALPILAVAAGIGLMALLIWLSGVHLGRNGSRFQARWGSPPPCLSPTAIECRQIDELVARTYSDANACGKPERIVCIVPVGAVSPEMLVAITTRLAGETQIPVAVAPPLALTEAYFNQRRGQYDGEAITKLAAETYADIIQETGGLLLALTPVDIYLPSVERWRYAFGVHEHYRGSLNTGVVSTLRMALVDFYRPVKLPLGGDLDILVWPSDRKVESRAYKMVLKYVGLGYLGLPLSGDPQSVMYNNILSVADLDRMNAELPDVHP